MKLVFLVGRDSSSTRQSIETVCLPGVQPVAILLDKRRIDGTFHNVSIKPWPLRQWFSYRFNRRDSQLEMFGTTIKNLVRGDVLSYEELTASSIDGN